MYAADNSIDTYGKINTHAPAQLSTFSFLIGKWRGNKVVNLPDGTQAEFEWTWIGRYILDGTAIADELHAKNLDSSPPYLGITFRQYDAIKQSWIIEFLNVSNSFIRKQVNSTSGSVTSTGNIITVISESGNTLIREIYELQGETQFTYRLNTSEDKGESWGETQMEMTLTRID